MPLVRSIAAPLTRTRLFRAAAPVLLPHVERVRGRPLPVRAHLIAPGDRDAAWARIEAQWPGYRAYERDSGRVVRLFLLRPITRPTSP
ncbi:hypothetical protein BJQ94_07270 [Cryobacterium sp. SO2]|uniref:hypothetical protein n=1 Tax=Cryobacterium sp. SO2 TaxID=1897060 RepID=UPI00223DAF84|nr:hypothetical protein [Cryobacterium sp. SO2]WEO78823.1 hypothetical protein BJQ94_07270 [Cryobacterium sp. SO2]